MVVTKVSVRAVFALTDVLPASTQATRPGSLTGTVDLLVGAPPAAIPQLSTAVQQLVARSLIRSTSALESR